jgi:hypothetical protein
MLKRTGRGGMCGRASRARRLGALIGGGAPADEWDSEIVSLVAQIPRIKSQNDAVDVVCRVFSSAFQSGGFSPADCAQVGRRLYSSLRPLGSRRQWPSNAVRIWLENPTVAIDITSSDHKPVRVHAWGHNENDYNTAMMRLDEGDVLYAISNAEFEELRTRGGDQENAITRASSGPAGREASQ